MKDLGDLVIRDFDPVSNSEYVGRTQGWIYRDLEVRAEFASEASMPDPKANSAANKLQLATYYIQPVAKRVTPNPVVDTVSTSINDKQLALNLLAEPQQFETYSLNYGTEINWMGHGSKFHPIAIPWGRSMVGLRLEADGSHPDYGTNYKVIVTLKTADGALSKHDYNLSKMLDTYNQ